MVADPAPYSTGLVNINDALESIGPMEVDAPEPHEPMVTVVLNGMPMRMRAGGLYPALAKALQALHGVMLGHDGEPLTGKQKALLFAMKQAAGLMIPLLKPMVEKSRNDPRVPAAVKRILPDVPTVPRHADRLLFLMGYMTAVLYAALTENAWVIEVTPDDPDLDIEETDLVKVTRFEAVDPTALEGLGE